MRDIAIYGAGGLGREVFCLIRHINEEAPAWNLVGFFDDNLELKGKRNEYGVIFGGIDELNSWDKPLCVVMAIGSGTLVRNVVEKIHNKNIEYPNLIVHASFADKDNVKFGKGNIVTSGFFSCGVSIGDFNLMNGNVIFGHDVKVGDFNTFMPETRLSGEVVVGNENFFGIASIVLQQVKIGDRVRLGAGSVLMTRPKDGQLYIGNPAKIFKY